MLENKVLFSGEPAHEAANKGYIDRKFELAEKRSHVGHIPALEANTSKTGFIVNASSRKVGYRFQPYHAFCSAVNREWVAAADAGPGTYIEIWLPVPVRIWKFRLTGRRTNRNQIRSWKLHGGVVGGSGTLRAIYQSDFALGNNMQEFEVDSEISFNLYRLEVVTGAEEFGVSHFQIFTNNF